MPVTLPRSRLVTEGSRSTSPLPAIIAGTAGVVLLALALVACDAERCASCRDEKCSDLVRACTPDVDCRCMSNCIGDKGIPGVEACLGSCGLTARPARFVPLEQCVAVACPDAGDECSTPAGYQPPAADLADAADADLGGGDEQDCGFDPALPYDPGGSVLQLVSADGQVCVRLERRDDGAGTLANTRWTLLEARVGPLGAVAHVSDPGAMCWYSSHHNFLDWVHVWTGRTHHDLELAEDGHGGPRTYTLYTFSQGPLTGGTCEAWSDGVGSLGGPIELFPQ